LTNPEGDIFIVSGGFTHWCKQNNLSYHSIIHVVRGRQKHHKGWKARVII
jgi:hypothetical protein